MRILITISAMNERGGASLYVLELALELAARGFKPAVYSRIVGEMAAPLIDAGIPVAARIGDLGEFEPDVIHGQHHLEALAALLRFPNAPCVYLSHGREPSQEHPLPFPRVLRHLAVSEGARERAAAALGVPPDQIELSLNWVDLKRFGPRADLPPRPLRALMLSNHFTEENGLGILREACSQSGIELDARGSGVRETAMQPERILPQYDLIFGLGRAALEGAAVGCGVALCHPSGAGPFLTRGNFERLRTLNFGGGSLEEPLTSEAILQRIRNYDASEAAAVSERVRETASIERGVDRLVSIYNEVRAEFESQEREDRDTEMQAVREYLTGPGEELVVHRDQWRAAAHRADALTGRVAELEARLAAIDESITWKAGRFLGRLPLLRRALGRDWKR